MFGGGFGLPFGFGEDDDGMGGMGGRGAQREPVRARVRVCAHVFAAA